MNAYMSKMGFLESSVSPDCLTQLLSFQATGPKAAYDHLSTIWRCIYALKRSWGAWSQSHGVVWIFPRGQDITPARW